MVEHIVCFKLKQGTTSEEEQKLIDMLRALKEKVPGILSLTAGKTFTPERGQGFSVGLVVRFPDKEALAIYGPHPNHQPVKDYVAQVCESVMAVDYEV